MQKTGRFSKPSCKTRSAMWRVEHEWLHYWSDTEAELCREVLWVCVGAEVVHRAVVRQAAPSITLSSIALWFGFLILSSGMLGKAGLSHVLVAEASRLRKEVLRKERCGWREEHQRLQSSSPSSSNLPRQFDFVCKHKSFRRQGLQSQGNQCFFFAVGLAILREL